MRIIRAFGGRVAVKMGRRVDVVVCFGEKMKVGGVNKEWLCRCLVEQVWLDPSEYLFE